ncbi:MAG: hypothetical protein E7190_10035 [Erysipelotrichaceae bacterium]|nr:hypothetical protein [Erysipelotrichaceae bacterium]
MFSELGLNMTAVINIFLRTAIREKSIPFAITPDVPNEVTAAVIEEGRQRKVTQLFIKIVNPSESEKNAIIYSILPINIRLLPYGHRPWFHRVWSLLRQSPFRRQPRLRSFHRVPVRSLRSCRSDIRSYRSFRLRHIR